MRTLSIPLIPALVLLACGSPKDKPVATVNGTPITVAALTEVLPLRVDSTADMDTIRHRALDNLITKQLFVLEAARQGLDTAIEYQYELERRAVINQEFYNQVVGPGDQFSEMDVQAAYRLLATEAHLKVIAVEYETTAQRIVRELDQGTPFETLAVRHSQHGAAANGGDMGFVPQLFIEEPARSRVLPLKPGEHTPPFKTGNSYQVLLLAESRPNEQVPPLAEYRQELEMRLKQQRRRELANKFLADLRARLEYDPRGIAVITTRPVESLTEQDLELPVAVKDGSKYVKVSRLTRVAARFTPALDTAMKNYAIRREIEEDLIYQEALDRKLDRNPEVSRKLARKHDDLLYQALFRKEVSEVMPVTDADVFAYWRLNRDKFPSADSNAAAGMIRNRLTGERRTSRLKEYTDELRRDAKVSINEKLLATVKREPPIEKKK